jgi:hypothetical protein
VRTSDGPTPLPQEPVFPLAITILILLAVVAYAHRGF